MIDDSLLTDRMGTLKGFYDLTALLITYFLTCAFTVCMFSTDVCLFLPQKTTIDQTNFINKVIYRRSVRISKVCLGLSSMGVYWVKERYNGQ
jgi:hypothetical protein